MVSVTVGVAAAVAASMLGSGRLRAAVGGMALVAPIPTALGWAVWWTGRRAGAIGRARRAGRRLRREALLLAELAHLGLVAGLSIPVALHQAATGVGGATGAEALSALRAARASGLSRALGAAGASSHLLRVLAHALRTGSSAAPAVAAHASELRRELRAEELARARRLPVRLLLPLALLILPGFVVLTLGPAVLAGLDRIRS